MQLRNKKLVSVQFEDIAKSSQHSPVPCDAADEHHRRQDVLALDDAAAEVARYRFAQALQNLGNRVAFLLGVDHIRLGEDRAAAGNARRATRAADNFPDLLDVVKQARGLLVEKGSCAGSAIAARRVVQDSQAPGCGHLIQQNVFRASPAHFKDAARLRVINGGGLGDGFDFVFKIDSENLGDELASGAGHPDAFDLFLGNPVVEFVEEIEGGLHGAALDATVGRDQDG